MSTGRVRELSFGVAGSLDRGEVCDNGDFTGRVGE